MRIMDDFETTIDLCNMYLNFIATPPPANCHATSTYIMTLTFNSLHMNNVLMPMWGGPHPQQYTSLDWYILKSVMLLSTSLVITRFSFSNHCEV